VDIEVRQRKIDDILNELFAGTNVNYLVMNRQIVLTTAQPGSEEYATADCRAATRAGNR
jgi:hypothetical protein